MTMNLVTMLLFETLEENKNELKIDSFDDLTNYLEKHNIKITSETDIAKKTSIIIFQIYEKGRKKSLLSSLYIFLQISLCIYS